MSDERRKPTWPWIIVVLLGLPVLYVASFGPACWLVRHRWISRSTAAHAYRPIIKYTRFTPAWAKHAIVWYGGRDDYYGHTFVDLGVRLLAESEGEL